MVPLLQETTGTAPSPTSAALATPGRGLGGGLEPATNGRRARRLAVYPASAGFDLADELDHLCVRAIEPNIFFHPRFLAPAMPRLEDREVRLAVIRDDDPAGRLRMLVPFSIERAVSPTRVSFLRAWSHPFGPLGTPLLDGDDPAGALDDFLEVLSRPHLGLPQVFVFPDMGLDGPVTTLLHRVAVGRGLALETIDTSERPMLASHHDGETYLAQALHPRRRKELRRLQRRLAEQGRLEYRIGRHPEEVRLGVEAFLTLEARGWKGRRKTAMASDRYRAAFAREAMHGLAERDQCRVHSLVLDDRVIASLVVLLDSGTAYTWKTAYDEAFADYSPGLLLMVEVTKNHLDDPGITATDSCAVPDHPVVSRLWTQRRNMATLLVALTPAANRMVQRAARQIHRQRQARNLMRIWRNRLMRALSRH